MTEVTWAGAAAAAAAVTNVVTSRIVTKTCQKIPMILPFFPKN